ncbi:hypothetical protein [Actinoplanes sp. NPDC049265]|uniref:hypothetical protein n=1 Tax=Actinoplanes sp. NPDC049265 TaxID=3363902 RepID=UPI0037222D65
MRWVHAEVRKLLTLPALRVTAALTLAATVFLSWVDADPIAYTQVGFLVLGALAATESQRTTLLAMPRRLTLHVAKLVALTAVTAPIAVVAALPTAAATAAATAAYLILTTQLAFGVGTLIRHPLASVLALLASHVIAGPLLRSAYETASVYLPDTPAWRSEHGLPATVLWTVSALAISAYAFQRRDAR